MELNLKEIDKIVVFLDKSKEKILHKLIGETLTPYPHFVAHPDKINYPAINHTFWFLDEANKKLIDFHMVVFKANDGEFYINYFFGDKLLRGESKGPSLRINSSLTHAFVKENASHIGGTMNSFCLNVGKKFCTANDATFLNTDTILQKEAIENAILLYILDNHIPSDRLINYGEVIKKYYTKIYTTAMTKEVYEEQLLFINNYFKDKKILLEKIKEVKDDIADVDDSLQGVLERNAFKNRQLLVFGKHGVGKTYGIRKFVEKYGYELVNIQANNSIDDIYLKGHLIKDFSGNFKWKYGKLSLAYKKAAQGEKVIVFIDEFLRLPQTTFNNLITAMDPYDGYYIFDTERPIKSNQIEDEDCLETEELKVPISNLWFVCSTNIGQEYNVEELEPALKDRFIPYYLNMEENQKIALIKKIMTEKGYKKEINNVINFYKKMHVLYTTGVIDNDINIRHISDVVLMADDEDNIPHRIKDKILVWISNDLKGTPLKEQKDTILNLINGIWSI